MKNPFARDEILSTFLDLVAAGLIVFGVALWSVPVALILAGLAVLLATHPLPIGRGRA